MVRKPLEPVRVWVRGFARAMTLVPDVWDSLVEDERTQVLIAPFAAFMDIATHDFDPADDIDALLDEAGTPNFDPGLMPWQAAPVLQTGRSTLPQDRRAGVVPCTGCVAGK